MSTRMDKHPCLNEIDVLWKNLYTVRGALPYLRPSDVDATETQPRGYYEAKGVALILKFAKPLTLESIKDYNAMGYWVNQSFVIWLHALLEYHKVAGGGVRINHDLPGSADVEIVRRLRKIFVHTNGRYNENKPEERKLFDAIVKRYSPNPVDPVRFNLHINEVLEPMVASVKKYVSALDSRRKVL